MWAAPIALATPSSLNLSDPKPMWISLVSKPDESEVFGVELAEAESESEAKRRRVSTDDGDDDPELGGDATEDGADW